MTISLSSRKYKKNKQSIKASLCANSACPYCNAIMDPQGSSFSAVTIDHIKARAKGGTHDKDNLIAVCKFCNNRKAAKDNILLFKLKTPKKLQNNEYRRLDTYLELSNRINTLKELRKLALEDNLEDGLALLNKSKEVGVKQNLFNALINLINHATKNIKSILLQLQVIIKEIDSVIANMEEHYQASKRNVSNIEFTTYALVG